MGTATALTVDGRKLRAVRLKLGLSQRAMAVELDVSQSTLSSWERGEKLPRHGTQLVEVFARTLGVRPIDIAEERAA